MEHSGQKLRLNDVVEIILGAVIMGFPVAVTEEVWDFSAELSLGRVLFVAAGSIGILAWFAFYVFYHGTLKQSVGRFIVRILAVYVITLVAVGLLLFAIDKLPLLTEPVIAIKRMIIVALPASFTATFVDSIHTPKKED
jgi:uncharacterized membrane protein